MSDPYTRYMERLTGAVVVLVLGVAMVVAGWAVAMDQLVVQTRGEWFTVDLVDGQRFVIAEVVTAVGLAMAVWGSMLAKRAMRHYHRLRRMRGVARSSAFLGLAVTVLEVLQDAEGGERDV